MRITLRNFIGLQKAMLKLAFTIRRKRTAKPIELSSEVILVYRNGYSYSDIAVIVRKNKQATMVAEFLSAQTDPIIPVLSGESIVLSFSGEVGLILNFLKAFEYSDNHSKLFILNYLNDSACQKDYSVFFERNKDFYRSINLKKVLNAFSISFDFMKYECSSLMQKIYLIIAAFNINKLNPYITQFLSSSFDYIKQMDQVLLVLDFLKLRQIGFQLMLVLKMLLM